MHHELPMGSAVSVALPAGPILLPPPPPPFTPPPPPPPRTSWFNFDWEGLVGVKLFTGIGAIAFVLAMILLLKYSAEHGFLKPPIRAAMGLPTCALLIFVCRLPIAPNYKS